MADSPRESPNLVRLDITSGTIVTVLVAVLGAILATGLTVAARRVLSWVVACAVAAALIELVVDWLDSYMHRVVAIIVVLLAIGAVAGLLTFGVTHDLDQEVHRLQVAAPQAARDIQTSKRFGKIAREMNLDQRVTATVDQLRSPSSGLAGQAVSSVGTYLVNIILTILFLSWGPRLLRSASRQLESVQQAKVQRVLRSAFARARRYVSLAMLQSIVVGVIGYAVCELNHLPASAPVSLGLAVMTLIPSIGILIGSIPIVLLSTGLAPSNDAIATVVVMIGLQILSSLIFQPRIVTISRLYVGPATISIAFLAGFELYGIGGALYAAALFVLAVAVIDALEAENRSLTATTTKP
jgi:putative heme transporter